MKNHPYNLHALLRGILVSNSVNIARYASLTRDKSPQSMTHILQKAFCKHALALKTHILLRSSDIQLKAKNLWSVYTSSAMHPRLTSSRHIWQITVQIHAKNIWIRFSVKRVNSQLIINQVRYPCSSIIFRSSDLHFRISEAALLLYETIHGRPPITPN